MRELKFRAWDKFNSEYIEIDDLYWFEENSVHDNNDAQYEIEQFTGLLDKNGKMIFEGDVIKSIDIDEYCDERVETEKIEAVGSLNKYIETLSWIPKHGEIIGTIHDAEYKELAK